MAKLVSDIAVECNKHMPFRFAIRLFQDLFSRFYFSYGRSKWTDDPSYKVVQLGNNLSQLIAGRISEVIGATGPDEMYVLAPGDQAPGDRRYALIRVYADKIIEGTYLKEIDQSKPLVLVPRLIEEIDQSKPLNLVPRFAEIAGNPYKITRKATQTSELVLKVEDLNPAR